MSEAAIARRLISTILAKGYSISLDAEGEEFLSHCRDKDELYHNLDASDIITVRVDEGIGSFLLIWGNGDDIISDHTANEFCEEIMAELA